jgi:hypothetical protein
MPGRFDSWVIDPRVTKMGDTYYVVRPGQCHPLDGKDIGPCALLYKTKDFKTAEFIECISLPLNRVPCLFPEKINGDYVRLDRPYGLARVCPPGHPLDDQLTHGMWISYSPDMIHWGRHRPFLYPCMSYANYKVGPTPPIKTKDGWLEIIHGVSKENRESGGGKWVSLVELEVYTVGGSNASEQRMFLDGTDTEGVYDMYVLTNITKADTENNDRVSLIGKVTNTSNGKTADITLDIHDAFKYIDVVGVAYSAGDFDAGTDNDYLIGYTLKNVKVGYKIEYRICGFDKENKEVWTTENIIYTVK